MNAVIKASRRQIPLFWLVAVLLTQLIVAIAVFVPPSHASTIQQSTTGMMAAGY